ncbi:MAG: hypothetical protein V4598_04310 [Bdellovibrionota bacterium]
MKMISIIMLAALLSVSCNKGGGGGDSGPTDTTTPADQGTDQDEAPVVPTPAPTPDPTPEPEPVPEPPVVEPPVVVTPPAPTPDNSLPPEAYTFDTNVTLVNLTASQTTKMKKAMEIIKLVVATDEFRTKILNHTYNGSKTFVDNKGLTNAQIYQKILDGAESLQPTKDNELDCEVEMYTVTTNVVGYTYATSKRIWVNTKYFNQYTAAGVAHNLFHEWMHKLGFTHASTYSTSRDYSVPYAIGDLVGDIGKDFL